MRRTMRALAVFTAGAGADSASNVTPNALAVSTSDKGTYSVSPPFSLGA